MKLQLLMIVLATALAYSNIFANGFVIDDRYFIQEWGLTRSWSNVGQLLTGANPESQPGVYRPIRSLLYLVYYQLWGTNPMGYHLHSLLVHLAATVLVYLIIFNLQFLIFNKFSMSQFSNFLPFVAALLFGLHPIHTESITYIAASMEMTGVVFFLASFWAYLRSKRWQVWIWAGLAFFTYEMTLTLPLLLGLYEIILGKKNWKRIWPVAVVAGLYLFVRIGVVQIGPARGNYLAYSFYHTQLTMTRMWVKYLGLLVWPMDLSHNQTVASGFEAFMTPYSDGQAILRQSILDPEILFSIGVIGVIGVIGWKLRKIHPIVSFSVFWFFISLLPVAYIFPQGTAIAEKYLYIASIAWVMLLGYLISNFKFLISNQSLIFIVVIVITVFYGGRTYLRNRDWQGPRTLWEYEVRVHPQSELAYYNLGIIYAENGEKDKAMAAYRKVLQLKPEFWQAENNLKNL